MQLRWKYFIRIDYVAFSPNFLGRTLKSLNNRFQTSTTNYVMGIPQTTNENDIPCAYSSSCIVNNAVHIVNSVVIESLQWLNDGLKWNRKLCSLLCTITFYQQWRWTKLKTQFDVVDKVRCRNILSVPISVYAFKIRILHQIPASASINRVKSIFWKSCSLWVKIFVVS